MKSRKELRQVVARRYQKASKKLKGRILEEFVAATGYNRAYAAMLLRNYGRPRRIGYGSESVKLLGLNSRRRAGGRPARYTAAVQRAVEQLWKRFGYVCGKRLVPIMRACLPFLPCHPSLQISKDTAEALARISPASVDRLLAPARKRLFLRGLAHTRPVSGLAAQIPVRTFSEWQAVTPGHLQLDLVGHDGGIASGEFCFTLSATDVCTGWTERRAVLTKAARWVTAALDEIQSVMAFRVCEIHPDNGSEFINYNLSRYCTHRSIRITRSRSARKNDNCYVEQKNFDTVRKLVGYARYQGPDAVQALNELYRTHGLLLNYLYPSQKLLHKTRHGASVHKTHDKPISPADRLLARSDTDGRTRWKVHAVRQSLDPLALAADVATLQSRLLALATTRPIAASTRQGASA